jgi:hypothetical protein
VNYLDILSGVLERTVSVFCQASHSELSRYFSRGLAVITSKFSHEFSVVQLAV